MGGVLGTRSQTNQHRERLARLQWMHDSIRRIPTASFSRDIESPRNVSTDRTVSDPVVLVTEERFSDLELKHELVLNSLAKLYDKHEALLKEHYELKARVAAIEREDDPVMVGEEEKLNVA